MNTDETAQLAVEAIAMLNKLRRSIKAMSYDSYEEFKSMAHMSDNQTAYPVMSKLEGSAKNLLRIMDRKAEMYSDWISEGD